MSAAAPQSILGGRYQLVRPLAAGGMGTVWLARHVELETDVAIKLIEGAHARRPELLERFRREARAAAQLKTPNVVQILDYGVDAGVPYIAMELLDGEDLDGLLERERTLSPARVLEILRPLCRALGLAHAAGIVHRDLKPANVFLARVTGDEVVKLVDFGIAKEMNRGAEWTTGASMVGSPLFMSPEQIGGSANVDARTDVWSLAVMTYLMLFGEPPFFANGVAAILYRIAHDTFDVPSARAPGLAAFDAFFHKALARRPRDRYASVAELLAGFEQAVDAVADPKLAIEPIASPNARSGTVAMSASDAPSSAAFDGARVAGVSGVVRSSSEIDDDAVTRAVPSANVSAPHVSIPPPPRVTPSKAGPASRVNMTGVLIGVVVGVVGLAAYVAQSGDALPVSATSTPPSAAVPADARTADAPSVQPGRTAEAPPPADVAPPAPSAEPGANAQPTMPSAARTTEPSARASKPLPSSPPRPPPKAPNVDPEWGVPLH